MLQRLEDPKLHQKQRDRHIENEPHHPSGMAVGEPRKEIRPRDRARIGVGDVDLDLGDDDEGAGEGERDLRRREYVPERNEIHLRRLGRLVDRHQVADREICEEGTGQKLHEPGNDPAGAGGEIGGPPGHRSAPSFGPWERGRPARSFFV